MPNRWARPRTVLWFESISSPPHAEIWPSFQNPEWSVHTRPPMRSGFASYTPTLVNPRSVRRMAAVIPAMPAPTTAMRGCNAASKRPTRALEPCRSGRSHRPTPLRWSGTVAGSAERPTPRQREPRSRRRSGGRARPPADGGQRGVRAIVAPQWGEPDHRGPKARVGGIWRNPPRVSPEYRTPCCWTPACPTVTGSACAGCSSDEESFAESGCLALPGGAWVCQHR